MCLLRPNETGWGVRGGGWSNYPSSPRSPCAPCSPCSPCAPSPTGSPSCAPPLVVGVSPPYAPRHKPVLWSLLLLRYELSGWWSSVDVLVLDLAMGLPPWWCLSLVPLILAWLELVVAITGACWILGALACHGLELRERSLGSLASLGSTYTWWIRKTLSSGDAANYATSERSLISTRYPSTQVHVPMGTATSQH